MIAALEEMTPLVKLCSVNERFSETDALITEGTLVSQGIPAAYTVVILHGCAGSGPAETSALCSRESCSYAVTVCCSLSNSMDEL